MSDAISRSAMMRSLEEAEQRVIHDSEWPYTASVLAKVIVKVKEFVAELPALDAVPVVRCKDCFYLMKDGESLCCTYHDNINVTEEFFCSTGEVKNADTRQFV